VHLLGRVEGCPYLRPAFFCPMAAFSPLCSPLVLICYLMPAMRQKQGCLEYVRPPKIQFRFSRSAVSFGLPKFQFSFSPGPRTGTAHRYECPFVSLDFVTRYKRNCSSKMPSQIWETFIRRHLMAGISEQAIDFEHRCPPS
jgi:hypothetical protein